MGDAALKVEAIHRQIRKSTRDDWRTPPVIMSPILDRFRFTGDACASALNTWAPEFFTEEDNALIKSWKQLGPVVWMNPPYSMANEFMRRARLQAFEHGLTVCALLPSTMDVKWWHEDAITHAAELWFYRGRISFLDPVEVKPVTGNPVGSVLVVFRGNERIPQARIGQLCSVTGRPFSRSDVRYWNQETGGRP